MTVERLAPKVIGGLRADRDQLRKALAFNLTKLKLLYMAAGLGQKTGRAALDELSAVIANMEAALGHGEFQSKETK